MTTSRPPAPASQATPPTPAPRPLRAGDRGRPAASAPPPPASPLPAAARSAGRPVVARAGRWRGRLPFGAAALVVAVALAVATFGPVGDLLGGRAGPPAVAPGAAVVVRVVDGDTLVAEVDGAEERVRLIGIDTPETVAPNRPVECFGAEASHRLSELLPPGTAIRLERDVEPRDAYDRALAYVYRADDGLFVNAAQVADGYAEAKEYPPNTAWRPQLDEAERGARTAGVGLWGACGGADTPAAPP